MSLIILETEALHDGAHPHVGHGTVATPFKPRKNPPQTGRIKNSVGWWPAHVI